MNSRWRRADGGGEGWNGMVERAGDRGGGENSLWMNGMAKVYECTVWLEFNRMFSHVDAI